MILRRLMIVIVIGFSSQAGLANADLTDALKQLEKSCITSVKRNQKKIKHLNMPKAADICACLAENIKCEKFTVQEVKFLNRMYTTDRDASSKDENEFKTILDFDFHTAQACLNSTKYRVSTCQD